MVEGIEFQHEQVIESTNPENGVRGVFAWDNYRGVLIDITSVYQPGIKVSIPKPFIIDKGAKEY